LFLSIFCRERSNNCRYVCPSISLPPLSTKLPKKLSNGFHQILIIEGKLLQPSKLPFPVDIVGINACIREIRELGVSIELVY
jgi:hypothetical protein